MDETDLYGPVRQIEAVGADMPHGSVRVRLHRLCGAYVDSAYTETHDRQCFLS